MNFVVSIIHAVDDIFTASLFFCDVLGFQQQLQSEQCITVENGAIAIRLIPLASNQKPMDLTVEMQTKQLDSSISTLLANPQIKQLSEPIQITDDRIECMFSAPHHLLITVARDFNEDELDIYPDLPISLDWEETAIQCVQELLRLVPLGFRTQARQRITEQAEMLTAAEGDITVHLEQAVQALLKGTPDFQHPALILEFQKRGIHFNPLSKNESC